MATATRLPLKLEKHANPTRTFNAVTTQVAAWFTCFCVSLLYFMTFGLGSWVIGTVVLLAVSFPSIAMLSNIIHGTALREISFHLRGKEILAKSAPNTVDEFTVWGIVSAVTFSHSALLGLALIGYVFGF